MNKKEIKPKLPKATLLLVNSKEVITCSPVQGDLIGRIADGAIAIKGEKIIVVGTKQEVLNKVDPKGAKIIDLAGKVVAPGFVDAHTHVVFGGSRVKEYALKMTYAQEKIQSMGIPVGITGTMDMTRCASKKELIESASKRIEEMMRFGTTTIESKSGYGLSMKGEMKMLQVNRTLDEILPVDVVSTFLGAHAFPPGKSENEYVKEIIEKMIPAVKAENLAEFCDVYIDEGYFNLDQTRRIFDAARGAGLKLKMHADQYSSLGGSPLAAEFGVVSADHLNYTSYEEMKLLAKAGVIGVLMPMIDFAVKHPRALRPDLMRQAGMTLALATDMCPGGWTVSMQLVMQYACRMYGLSFSEALLASTVGGALALDLHDRGRLVPGMLADIQVWDVDEPEDLIYKLGGNRVDQIYKRGVQVL